MKSMQKGFTLIELMIVVAIIAILAAIAIPAYQNYLIRSQVTEGMTLMDGAKTAVAEYYSNHGTFPPSLASAGLPTGATSTQGSYVSQVDLIAGAGTGLGIIQAEFSDATPQKANTVLNGKFLTLSPLTSTGSIKWVCTNAGTTVDAKYLPASCR